MLRLLLPQAFRSACDVGVEELRANLARRSPIHPVANLNSSLCYSFELAANSLSVFMTNPRHSFVFNRLGLHLVKLSIRDLG